MTTYRDILIAKDSDNGSPMRFIHLSIINPEGKHCHFLSRLNTRLRHYWSIEKRSRGYCHGGTI